MITLTPVTIEDQAFLLALFVETKEDEFQFLQHEQRQHLLVQQFHLQHHAYQSQFPQHQHVIINYQDEQVGQARINYTDIALHIIDISILKAFQRQGVATKLIRQLQQEASLDEKSISLHVFYTNDSARSLYDKLGFHMTEQDVLYFTMVWKCSALSKGK